MTPEAKARASEMLAGLRADRFKQIREADLVALGIPYELRRSTQDDVLREKQSNPIKDRQSPYMSGEAFEYWSIRDSWAKISLSIARRLQKDWSRYQSTSLLEQLHCQAADVRKHWDRVPAIDKLRFWHPNPNPRWAWHWPTLAVVNGDHTLAWWPHGTPEYRRQLRLLEWAMEAQP